MNKKKGQVIALFLNLEIKNSYASLRALFIFSGVIGIDLTLAPTAFSIAFAIAGATTVVAGSPVPAGSVHFE